MFWPLAINQFSVCRPFPVGYLPTSTFSLNLHISPDHYLTPPSWIRERMFLTPIRMTDHDYPHSFSCSSSLATISPTNSRVEHRCSIKMVSSAASTLEPHRIS